MTQPNSVKFLEDAVAVDPVGASEIQKIIDRDATRFWSVWSSSHKLPDGALFLLMRLAYNKGYMNGLKFLGGGR